MKAAAAIASRTADHATAIAVATAIVALALDSGGFGGVAIGVTGAAAWLAIIVLAVAGGARAITRSAALAAGALAVLAVLGAFSLGWSLDRGTGFVDVVRMSAYLGLFVLAAITLRPGSGRSALIGIAAGLVAVCLIALGSRLLGIGSGDGALVAAFPVSAGRLSFPIGYWNALGALAAMAVPVLVWLASDHRGRTTGLALAAIPPAVLAAHMTSSRGALIAAVVGAVIVIAAAETRSRALAVVVVGALTSLPAVIAATLAAGILDAPLTSPGRAEYLVVAMLFAGIGLGAALGPAAVTRFDATRIPGLRMRHVLAAVFVALVALILVVGPGEIAGDFASTAGREAKAGGETLSVSGSGRAQFWSAALDGFAAEPLRGIGSGSYALYWNQHGELETPVQNAHSEPLELLAELGPLGLAAFVAFFAAVAVAGIRRARAPGGAAAGACLGLLATGLAGVLIDWTWGFPAVAMPMLVAAAVLSGRALDPSSGPAPAGRRAELRMPAPAFAVVAIALALPSLWAAGVLAVATDRLAASDDALARGQLGEAAAAARSAAAVEPWSAGPWIALATIEQSAGNLDGARNDARRAIAITPDDFRSWLLLLQIESGRGNDQVAGYGERMFALAPLLLSRAAIDPKLAAPTVP